MRGPVPSFCILAGLLAAGCTGPAEGESGFEVGYDSGNVVVVEDDDGSAVPVRVTNDTGSVLARVLSDAGIALPGSEATISGWAYDTTVANATGWFQFVDLKPGAWVIRVKHEHYRAAESPIRVEAGKVTRVTITMIPIDLESGYNPHPHDFWNGKDTYTVFDGQIDFGGDDVTQGPPRVCAGTGGCSQYFPIVPEFGRIVPPGTGNLSIRFSTEDGPFFARESFRIEVVTPKVTVNDSYKSYSENFSPDSPTKTFEFAVPSPEFVDHGHATRTSWSFTLRAGGGANAVVAALGGAWYEYLFRNPVDVKITAHKVGLPLDPPHPRFWKDSDRLVMPMQRPTYLTFLLAGALACTRLADIADRDCARSPNPGFYVSGESERSCNGDGCMALNSGGLVPPGTTRIEFDLEHWWTEAKTQGVQTGAAGAAFTKDQFILGYKDASIPIGYATWDDYTWIEPVGTFTPAAVDGRLNQEGGRYVIQVEPEQTDPFYTRLSDWVFMIAVQGHEDAPSFDDQECYEEACGRPYFEMQNFTVINEDRDETLT